MKKILAIALVVVMAAGLIACSGNKNNEPTKVIPESTSAQASVTGDAKPDDFGNVSGDASGNVSGNAYYDRTAIGQGVTIGGWITTDWNESKLSEEDQATFDQAVEGFVGGNLVPCAVLATQVVSGTNLAILCQETLATQKAEKNWVIAFIYKPLDGKAELTKVVDFYYEKYASEDNSKMPEQLDGGWNPCEFTEMTIQNDFKTPFKKATEGYTGVTFTGLACLGTQVVAGTNYVYVCGATTVTKEPVNYIAIVVVYETLRGSSRIESIGYIDIAKIAES